MGLFLSEADHLFVLASFVGTACPAQIDGFQNIRLSLRVVAEKKIGSRVKFQFERLIIAELTQFYGIYDHFVCPPFMLLCGSARF